MQLIGSDRAEVGQQTTGGGISLRLKDRPGANNEAVRGLSRDVAELRALPHTGPTGTVLRGISRHPASMIARVRRRWLEEVRQMSAIGTLRRADQDREGRIIGPEGRAYKGREPTRLILGRDRRAVTD